jgi:hypothetical protein
VNIVGKVLLALGSGLGVWVITNLDSVGMSDLAIVFLFIAVGAVLTSQQPKDQ